jgi:hypothetical protein
MWYPLDGHYIAAALPVPAPAPSVWSTIWPDLIKGLPAAFVALVIGIIAAGIAYRQYRVARAKFKFDLFEKRYTLFDSVWTILSETAVRGVQAEGGLGTPFSNLTAQAAFLFGPEISDYLREANDKWMDIWAIAIRTQGNNRIVLPADVQPLADLKRWFLAQAKTGVKEKFGKYLDFSRWT